MNTLEKKLEEDLEIIRAFKNESSIIGCSGNISVEPKTHIYTKEDITMLGLEERGRHATFYYKKYNLTIYGISQDDSYEYNCRYIFQPLSIHDGDLEAVDLKKD